MLITLSGAIDNIAPTRIKGRSYIILFIVCLNNVVIVKWLAENNTVLTSLREILEM